MSRTRLLAALGAVAALAVTAAAAAPAAEATAIEVAPARAAPGTTLAIVGAGFLPGKRVRLYIGSPATEGAPVGSVVAGSDGRFVRQVVTSTTTTPGRYVAVACQRGCRIKASAPLRIRF